MCLIMTDIIPSASELLDEGLATNVEKHGEFAFTTHKVTPENADLWLDMGLLRAKVYLKEKYITPEDCDENGAEYDEFDERADHFVALTEQGEVIGTVRVINRGDSNEPLPSEAEFNVTLPEQTQEISRFIRSPDLTLTEGLLVSLSLMRAAQKATQHKSDTIYAVLEDKLHRQLGTHIGIDLKTVGEPLVIEKYNSTTNHLVEMEPILITSQIHERDERTYERAQDHPRLAESILGMPFAPFFESANATQGLGRVSLSSLTEPNLAQFERNSGFFSPEEQKKLFNSTVAIAGAGGDGGQLAITLANMGVRHFKLADPERFEAQNLNRQAEATYGTIGKFKAEVLAKKLRALHATVEIYKDGVTRDNVERFTDGVDLIIDETEFTMPEIGTMIAREARKKDVFVLMALNVGFGSYTTTFAPDGITFEKYLGLDENMTIDEIQAWGANKNNNVPVDKWLPHIPSYANTDILGQVARDEISTPTIAPGVMYAAAEASTQAVALLLKEVNQNWASWISWAPQGRSVDAKDGSTIVKSRSIEFTVTSLFAAFRTKIGKSHPIRKPKQ